MTTKTKTPTAQGISRLLRESGFDRSVSEGRSGRSPGYTVHGIYEQEAVEIYYVGASIRPPNHIVDRAVSGYAKAVTDAGYAVERDGRRLIVTAKTSDA